MAPGRRVVVLPQTSTDTPLASQGPEVISQFRGRSSSSNLSRRGFARTASIIYVVDYREACFHAQVHAGVFDSAAEVVPTRLLEIVTEGFLKLVAVNHVSRTGCRPV